MLGQNYPEFEWILEFCTITIFVPAGLILVVVLTVVTRRWDRKDEAARRSRPPR